MMIDAPGGINEHSEDESTNGGGVDDGIVLTEDNAEEVMRYFNNMIS